MAVPGSYPALRVRPGTVLVIGWGIPGNFPSHNPFRCKLFWQGFGPDGYVVIMPVRPLHADAVHRIADPADLPVDNTGQEIERDFPLSHGFAFRHFFVRHSFPGNSSPVSLFAIIIPIRFPRLFG